MQDIHEPLRPIHRQREPLEVLHVFHDERSAATIRLGPGYEYTGR